MSELKANEVYTDQEFEMAVSHIGQGDYRKAAQYLIENPGKHQKLYDELVSRYSSHETPDKFAALMQEEMEKIKQGKGGEVDVGYKD